MAEKVGDKSRRRRGRKGDDNKDNLKLKKNGSKSDNRLDVVESKAHKSLLIQFTEEAPTWFDCGKNTPGRDDTIATDPPSASDPKNAQLVSKYRAEADDLFRAEVSLFSNINGQSSSDERWVENTMKRGTLKDRIAAMSVVVSTDPFHKLYALDGLLQMAGCSENSSATQSNARMGQMAAEALEDLFLNTFLPKNRKLVSLDQRPLYRYEPDSQKNNVKKTLSPRILLLWRYEEMVRNKYQLFLRQHLMQTLRDGMEMSKLFALRSASTLLRSAPEGEAQLLGMIVNKLGDPANKTAAAAGHELRRILEQHANMQIIIAREVQQLAHRPHLSPRALYNCITFLNQLKLRHVEEDTSSSKSSNKDGGSRKEKAPKPFSLPASLINTYFRLFEVAVSQRKSEDPNSSAGMKSRLLSALLTGVNRAHPFLPDEDKDLEQHIDSLYRVVHTAPPSASTQALMLLFHVAVGSGEDKKAKKSKTNTTVGEDRFYRALYATLSQPSIVSAGKHLTMFFNLLYKAMKRDSNSVRVIAFAKRLLCTTLHCNAPVTAGSLFLLNEIMKYHPQLKSCFVDKIEGFNAFAVLDPVKREPSAALVSYQDHDDKTIISRAPLWEVCLISHHFHPSVSKFASSLGGINYSGDPLRDFGLAPFLDKFAYRNPKTSKRAVRGDSVAERRSGTQGEIEALKSLPVNDPSFLKKGDINEQEEFYHKFFMERARRDELKGTVRGNQDGPTTDRDEDDALDMVEDTELDHNFDEGWDTDPEEEAFVDALAEKLMEDADDGHIDMDDEDPDTEGWDDLYSDDEAKSDGKKKNGDSDDEDEFMDKLDDDSHEDDDDVPDFGAHDDDSNDDDAFMDEMGDDSSGDEGQDDDANAFDDDSDGDSDDEGRNNDLALLAESDSDDSEPVKTNKTLKSKRSREEAGTFVDASEYEERINMAWQGKKHQSAASTEETADTDKGIASTPTSSGGKKKRKRRKKKHSESE